MVLEMGCRVSIGSDIYKMIAGDLLEGADDVGGTGCFHTLFLTMKQGWGCACVWGVIIEGINAWQRPSV